MLQIHPQRIEGRWHTGIALDFHTTSSLPVGHNEAGHMQFETVRPPIAELLFLLKYRGDRSAAAGIVKAATAFLWPHIEKIDVLVPVPPSSVRLFQPVLVLAHGIGAAIGVPVVECVSATRATTQLKGVTDPEERSRLVNGLYAVDKTRIAGRSVLLFDDLFRSGTTMNAITDLLYQQGEVPIVRALTVTKTRSNR